MLTQIGAWLVKKQFIKASRSGNLDKVRYFIEAVNQETKDTALIRAANEGHEDVVKDLLQAGADPQKRDTQGFTALMWAAYQGYDDVVSVMLTQGVDRTMRTKDGRTALIWAVKAGRLDTVECFLESGNADLEIRDGSGFTALIHAAYNGHVDIAKTFIKAGADPNVRTNHNESVLMWAADQGKGKIVQILLDAGADPNAIDSEGKTALMWAVTQKRGRMGGHGIRSYVRGAATSSVGAIGGNFLDLDTVRILLEAGVDLNAKDENGETALSKASRARYTEIIELLQKAGATD